MKFLGGSFIGGSTVRMCVIIALHVSRKRITLVMVHIVIKLANTQAHFLESRHRLLKSQN